MSHPAAPDLRHLVSDTPRIMVVDGSKLVRRLIGDVLRQEVPNVEVVACAGLSEAREALEQLREITLLRLKESLT